MALTQQGGAPRATRADGQGAQHGVFPVNTVSFTSIKYTLSLPMAGVADGSLNALGRMFQSLHRVYSNKLRATMARLSHIVSRFVMKSTCLPERPPWS